MSALRSLLVAPAFLILGLAEAAVGSDQASTSVPSDPVFQALLTDGTSASGLIRRLGEKDGVTLVGGDGAERSIPFDRLVRLAREGTVPLPWTNEGEIVLFPDGDRLAHCVIASAGAADLDVQPMAIGKLPVPLDAILGLIFKPPSEQEVLDALESQVRDTPRTSELLWLANGDKLPGLLAGLDEKKITFQPPAGRVDIDRSGSSGAVALGFAQAQVVYKRPKGSYFELTLIDGTRLGLTDVRIEHGQVVGSTRFQAPVRFSVGDLAQGRALNGPVSYLSDREASGSQYVAYVGPTRPYRRNASVDGRPLHIGGKSYDRGIGTQSRTLLAYKLEPGAKRFQALVGLDDGAGPLGNVVFKALVDGKVRYESPAMGSGEAPKAVDVDLAGAKVLILITEFGERGDVQDGGDWVEARIVR